MSSKEHRRPQFKIEPNSAREHDKSARLHGKSASMHGKSASVHGESALMPRKKLCTQMNDIWTVRNITMKRHNCFSQIFSKLGQKF